MSKYNGKLFKYMPIRADGNKKKLHKVIGDFLSNKIQLTKILDSNDITEFISEKLLNEKITLSEDIYLPSNLLEYSSDKVTFYKIPKENVQEYSLKFKMLMNSFFYSFTDACDSLFHWKYQANNSDGICFEFDTNELINNLCINEIEYTSFLYPATKDQDTGLIKFAEYGKVRKLLDFSIEKELRATLADSVKIPENGLIDFHGNILKAIYFGVNVKVSDREKIVNKIKTNEGYRNLSLYQMVFSNQKIGIEFVEI